MSSPVPTVKRSKASKIKELVEEAAPECIKIDDIPMPSQAEMNDASQATEEYKSPVVKKREPKVPAAPKAKRKAEAQNDNDKEESEIEIKRSDAVGCEPKPKKQRTKKPKVAGFMCCVDNEYTLFKTHKEANDYWRSKEGEGEFKGVYECDYGKPLDFLK